MNYFINEVALVHNILRISSCAIVGCVTLLFFEIETSKLGNRGPLIYELKMTTGVEYNRLENVCVMNIIVRMVFKICLILGDDICLLYIENYTFNIFRLFFKIIYPPWGIHFFCCLN